MYISSSRSRSNRRGPSGPIRDRFGDNFSKFSSSKKSKSYRALSLSTRHKSTVRNQNPNSYRNTIEKKKNEVPKMLNLKTEKILLQKFNKEFMGILRELVKNEIVPIVIDSYVFS